MGTPAASTLGTCPVKLGLSGGKGLVCCCAGGGIAPPGDARGSGGGLIGYICEVRRETVVDDCRDVE